ncbi:uncharacterized protein LOC117327086 [Pecten maximus]|uniref:uncharacterized protein LOC117327086 n=1 Tax=Pecten maximus TaxID=6579 RepID=UPI001458E903|nr:uncharacterized protein LOC117327086 [Pecten maximus]
MAGQVAATRHPGQTYCVYHRQKILDWFCETCHNVICAECVSTSHKGHNNILLSKITPDNKIKIKTFIENTEQKGLIQIQEEIDFTQDSLKRHLKQFESLSAEVKEQGEKIKEDVDVLIDQTLSQLIHLIEGNTPILTTYTSELERKLVERKNQINQCKETLQIGTDIQVYDAMIEMQANITLPGKPVLGTANFTPNHNRNKVLKQAFGTLTITQHGHLQGQSEHKQIQSFSCLQTDQSQTAQDQHALEISSSEQTPEKETSPSKQIPEKEISPSKQASEKETSMSKQTPEKETSSSKHTPEKETSMSKQTPEKETSMSKQTPEKEILLYRRAAQSAITTSGQPTLLQDTTILSVWNVPRITISSCAPCGGDIWTSDWFSNDVIKLNSRGKEKQRISCSVGVSDISISPSTTNFWICSNEDSSVMEQESGTTALIHRFNTRAEPRCLCVKRDGLVLVGMKHCIEEYTPDGIYIIATKKSWLWKPSVRSPVKISQCLVSGNVAVVDLDKSSDGGLDEALVIVMDKHLQELHRYGQQEHKSKARSAPFAPLDLTYDTLGNLVVTDFDNRCLHLLSGDGEYLRRLHTDHDMPCAICVDSDGVLWVGFGGSIMIPNKLKRIQHIGV